MKYFFGLLLLIGLVSCNDQPSPTEPRPKISKDSNLVKPQSVNPYDPIDVSPMDMSYLPADYPKMQSRPVPPVARIIYSRPHKQGRKIFGALLKYGEHWRLGANEATEIEIFQPVTIQNKVLRGRYIMYCIPQEDKWTIVFNKDLFSWGLTQDTTKDFLKFIIPIQKKKQSVEYFSIVFQQKEPGTADLVMAWDDVEARLPFQYHEKNVRNNRDTK